MNMMDKKIFNAIRSGLTKGIERYAEARQQYLEDPGNPQAEQDMKDHKEILVQTLQGALLQLEGKGLH